MQRQPRARQLPAVVTALKNALQAADGILFVTPEYNYIVPGQLKNALDWVLTQPEVTLLMGAQRFDAQQNFTQLRTWKLVARHLVRLPREPDPNSHRNFSRATVEWRGERRRTRAVTS